MKPIVGIFAEIDDEKAARVMHAYVHAIEIAGGTPLLLPYIEDDEVLARAIALCNGIFFTGGPDIEPKRYGEETDPLCGTVCIYRDDLEFRAFAHAMAAKKPILAVCRGAQLVNVALGGTLYQDITAWTTLQHRQCEPKTAHSHGVRVIENTPLAALAGASYIPANSFHHQAVKDLGEGLRVMAESDDGVIEAFCLEGAHYIRAYQWHPERLVGHDEVERSIFEDFVAACRGDSYTRAIAR